MKKLLCLLFAAFLLCVSASALELPSGLDDIVPRELIDSAEAGDDLLLRGGQYLFSHFRAALQDAVANSLRGAMALVVGALQAEEESTITGIKHLRRGYDNLEENLRALGADVKCVEIC